MNPVHTKHSGYDIIGDIHGESQPLERLLKKLGYKPENDCWRHESRQVIFLGDFIDRGPQQRRVLDIVIPMVRHGSALAVMGNHEFNALAFHTPNDAEGWLRPHTEKNIGQHRAFLDEYQDDSALEDALAFFWSLPLWLDLDGLRIVHACWDSEAIKQLKKEHEGPRLTPELLRRASSSECWEYGAVETLLKGKELALPSSHPGYLDKDGNRRTHMRVAWWDKKATTYREAFVGPESARAAVPDTPTNGRHLVPYLGGSKPLFVGHYWLTGEPSSLTNNIACLDYSVAKKGGKLVAYKWSGESEILSGNFAHAGRE